MFAKLEFSMANSNGMNVTACVSNQKGRISYRILFPDLGITDVAESELEKNASDKFIRKLTAMNLESLLYRYLDMEMKEEGSVWRLRFEGSQGPIEVSGPAFRKCSLGTLMEDLAELLDATFVATKFIDPHRIDSLDVIFQYNELHPDMSKYLRGYEESEHVECLTLDREAEVLTFAKRYPSQCFNSLLESNCDVQVRTVLDCLGELLASNDELFEDNVLPDPELPLVHFCVEFHDGTRQKTARSLSLEGLRDVEFLELLDVLSELLLHLMFKNGLFDKRFLFPSEERRETPFFVVYSEDDEQLIGRLKDLQENA